MGSMVQPFYRIRIKMHTIFYLKSSEGKKKFQRNWQDKLGVSFLYVRVRRMQHACMCVVFPCDYYHLMDWEDIFTEEFKLWRQIYRFYTKIIRKLNQLEYDCQQWILKSTCWYSEASEFVGAASLILVDKTAVLNSIQVKSNTPDEVVRSAG